ncbi:MAG: hypothetical protein ACPGKP_11405, partial [Ilumatobacteraceae bacterium]
QDAFHNIYEYPHDCDGKFSRILNSIRNSDELLPAVALASEHGDLSIWRKIRRVSKSVFDTHASEEVKDRLAALKKEAAVNAVMNMAEFSLNNPKTEADKPKSTSTSTSTSTTEEKEVVTPSTPAQLVSLQSGSRNREFSENDIATLIVNNQGDNFIYDSYLDQFYHYDDDLDIWYFQDEQHIKRRIVLALDALIAGGALP